MSAAPTGAWPEVTDAGAIDDKAWFDDHPNRRFRARSGGGATWLIRRRGGDVFLRTFAQLAKVATSEDEIEAQWWLAAWPNLSPKEREELTKASRRGQKRGRTT
jgi:hypothetical protein